MQCVTYSETHMTQPIDYTLLGMLFGGVFGLIATVLIHIGFIGEFLAIGMVLGGGIGTVLKYTRPHNWETTTS